jgi:hypothetical protein
LKPGGVFTRKESDKIGGKKGDKKNEKEAFFFWRGGRGESQRWKGGGIMGSEN